MKNKLFEKLLPIYGLELKDKQVAKLLNVSSATLYRMRMSNEIKYKKRTSTGSGAKNGTIVYNLIDIIDYICDEK